MQNTSFMGELINVLKESLRKQAFSVILLICACAALWTIRQDDKQELQTEILALKIESRTCAEAREALAVEVGALRARVGVMEISRK